MTRHLVSAWLAIAAFVLAGATVGAFADSHVRIVRLSSVEGQVQMDRATGEGLERAILNTPILEGSRIVTGNDGLAEVEFENQSALRLTEDSEVKFSQLVMNDAGTKTNQIEVVKGLVYLDTASKGDDIYRVTVDGTSLLVRRDSLMRLSAAPDKVQIAVFKGDVQLENQAQPVMVQKKETLSFDPKNVSGYTVAKGTEPVRFDAWNKERESYSNTYAMNAGYGGPNRGYGLQDLNYYGDFFYANGYGYVWQPYGFANAMTGWDPYSNGAWMFYPGMGYSFASAYPWGWLPFHYGSWAFVNGAGWAWVPGRYNGQWYASNFQNVPKVTKAPAGWTAASAPAVTGTRAPTVLVGKMATSQAAVPGGRIPPRFGSVLPGRAVAATAPGKGFDRPAAGTANSAHRTFAAPNAAMGAAHQGSAGHVFAPPPIRAASVGPAIAEPGGFGRVSGATAMPHGHGGAVGGTAHGTSSAAGHK